MQIKIYTDGSSLGNPGPGGFCAIIHAGEKKNIVKGGAIHTTNNRMEMSAIIAGLYWVNKNFPGEKKCAVFSDSNLLIQTLVKGWKRKKNLDLWSKLDALREKFEEITWTWVKGHANHIQNIEADKIATREAARFKTHRVQPKI